MATDDHSAVSQQERGRDRRSLRRRVARALRLPGIIVVLLAGYVAWFLAGRPQQTVDYVAALNRMVQPTGLTHEDNAWLHYERAVRLLSSRALDEAAQYVVWHDNLAYSGLGEAEREAITKWIEDNDPVWQELVLAVQKPRCWKTYTVREPRESDIKGLDAPTLYINMEHLTQLRRLLTLARWRIRAEVERGQTKAALDDCLVLVRMGSQWSENQPLLDTLLGIGLWNAGHSELIRVLADAPLGEIDWRDVDHRLQAACPSGLPAINLDFERLQFLDIVQHTFTRGGLGGGHLVPQLLWPFVQSHSFVKKLGGPLSTEPTWRQRSLYVVMSLLHARRNATVEKYDALLARLKEVMSMTPQRSKVAGPPQVEWPDIFNNRIRFRSFFSDARFFMATTSAPIDYLSQVWWESAAWHDAARSVLAIHRWRQEHREYPETLQQLVDGGYIDVLPADPYADGCLAYRKTGDSFILYSRGRNFQDDGGKSLADPNHWHEQWGNPLEGDAVLWPVPPYRTSPVGLPEDRGSVEDAH